MNTSWGKHLNKTEKTENVKKKLTNHHNNNYHNFVFRL